MPRSGPIPTELWACKDGALPTGGWACSRNAKRHLYSQHSTNPCRNLGHQSAALHPTYSGMNEKTGRIQWARSDGLAQPTSGVSLLQAQPPFSAFEWKSLSEVAYGYDNYVKLNHTENVMREFFTEGIIHCWKSPATTWNPTTTSTHLLMRKRLRIRLVLGKLSS